MDKPAGGGPPVERKVFDFKCPGVAMGMHNRDADHPWLTTNQFLDTLDGNLKRAMS